MKYRHYSPRAEMIIVEGTMENAAAKINELCEAGIRSGKKVGILATDQTRDLYIRGHVLSMGDRNWPLTIASSIFGRLREFDHMGVDVIFSESIDESSIGLAVMNRMRKAAGYSIIKV
jgi:L-threonylcarbamoyladenylate synthase